VDAHVPAAGRGGECVMAEDPYAETVRLLRDVTANYDAATEGMFRGGVSGLTEPAGPPAFEDIEDAIEEMDYLAEMQRKLEVVALYALGKLGSDSAHKAIEEADAGWLHEAILRRAIETLPAAGGDA